MELSSSERLYEARFAVLTSPSGLAVVGLVKLVVKAQTGGSLWRGGWSKAFKSWFETNPKAPRELGQDFEPSSAKAQAIGFPTNCLPAPGPKKHRI